MKHIYTLFTVFILGLGTTFAQTVWVKQKIDDRVSIKFPATPQVNKGIYSLATKDSVKYVVYGVDFAKVSTLDSAALYENNQTQDFADSFKQGLTGSFKSHTLGDITINNWKNHVSYLVSGRSDTKKTTAYIRVVYVGTVLYSFLVVVPDGVDPKIKDSFWESAELIN